MTIRILPRAETYQVIPSGDEGQFSLIVMDSNGTIWRVIPDDHGGRSTYQVLFEKGADTSANHP